MQPVALREPARIQTISDIARLAGVSKSTVSRALNDSPLIGQETKDRVRAIAEEHDFAFNEPARRLSLKQSNVAGLVMFGKQPGYVPDLFMLELMGGIAGGLHEQGYELLIVQPDDDESDFARRYVSSGRADGFIVLSPSCSPRRLQLLTESGAPFVVWGRHAPGTEYSSVAGDNVAGGRLATQRLLETGRQRIALVGGPEWAPEIVDRRRGYEAALADAGLADEALVVHTPFSDPERNAAEVVARLLDEHAIDGVVASSDRYALGAIDAVRARGLEVPDDVGVVGYDDVAIAPFASPPLTTIRQDGMLAGRLLARALVQQIQTGAVTNVVMPAELVVRESA
jgi:DNA-binding LacI/PurR family transcriptional regulator